MKNLSVKECLQTENIVHVQEEQRPRLETSNTIYAVFNDSTPQNLFCGLVTAHDVSLHPDWIFADLCQDLPTIRVTLESDIEHAVSLMEEYDREILPVLENNELVGIVTRKHILELLIERDRKLLDESRRLHRELKTEHEQVLSWSNRLYELHNASRNLLANLAYTSIEFEAIQAGVESVSKLLQCNYVAVGLLGAEGEIEQFISSGLTSKQAQYIGQLINQSGVIDAALNKESSLIFSDLENQVQCIDLSSLDPSINTLLAVPLSLHNHLYGHVYVADKISGESFDHNDEVLVRSFAHSLSLALDNCRKREEVEKARLNLDFISNYDSLTKLPNRNLFTDKLIQAITEAEENSTAFTVMFIDVDGFKTINESLGHQAGDQLLKKIAERLSACLTQNDVLARFGGDEFVLLLPNAKAQTNATEVAESIITNLQQPFSVYDHEIFISVSIGIAHYPDNAHSVEKILAHADTALYHAKSFGKNQYRFFIDEMNTAIHDHFELENLLRHAIQHNELELFYQPKIAIDSGNTVGFEALLRWHSAEYGAVAPATFIPLAEESGLIIPIGEWVINEACRQGSVWLDEGYTARISVNLSGRQFHHIGNKENRLYEVVAEALNKYNLPAELLELEITENIMMHHLNESLQTLEQLKKLGVQISIDDFGTGYSSLSYIKKFPIDSLKIDKSFIEDLVNDPNDAAIVTAIIAMAQQLNIKVVVEGVETEEQLAFFKNNNYDVLVQGYYFCRPVPADQIAYIFSN